MNKYKVSVCVSVYNTERYIRRCLDSLVNQSLKEIEIVVVNDGSTDGTAQILDEYSKRYDNIVVISQVNSGLSIGRKVGVENSQGEYIAFLDADDYILADAYEKLYNYACKHDVDIVEMDTKWGEKLISSNQNDIISSHTYLKRYLWGNPIIWPMLWLRIYKKELFREGVFTELYCNNEDIFAFPCLLYNAKNIGFLHEQLHIYSIDYEDSIERGLPNNKMLADKYFSNRVTTLESVNHIGEYIKVSENSEFYNFFLQYKQIRIITFLHTDIFDVSYAEKYEMVCKVLDFKNVREIKRFVRQNTNNNSLYSVIIRLFGIRVSKYLRDLKKIFNKRK